MIDLNSLQSDPEFKARTPAERQQLLAAAQAQNAAGPTTPAPAPKPAAAPTTAPTGPTNYQKYFANPAAGALAAAAGPLGALLSKGPGGTPPPAGGSGSIPEAISQAAVGQTPTQTAINAASMGAGKLIGPGTSLASKLLRPVARTGMVAGAGALSNMAQGQDPAIGALHGGVQQGFGEVAAPLLSGLGHLGKKALNRADISRLGGAISTILPGIKAKNINDFDEAFRGGGAIAQTSEKLRAHEGKLAQWLGDPNVSDVPTDIGPSDINPLGTTTIPGRKSGTYMAPEQNTAPSGKMVVLKDAIADRKPFSMELPTPLANKLTNQTTTTLTAPGSFTDAIKQLDDLNKIGYGPTGDALSKHVANQARSDAHVLLENIKSALNRYGAINGRPGIGDQYFGLRKDVNKAYLFTKILGEDELWDPKGRIKWDQLVPLMANRNGGYREDLVRTLGRDGAQKFITKVNRDASPTVSDIPARFGFFIRAHGVRPSVGFHPQIGQRVGDVPRYFPKLPPAVPGLAAGAALSDVLNQVTGNQQ